MDYSQAVIASEMHDSELSEIVTQDDHIRLVFSNISLTLDDDVYVRAVVDLYGVRRVALFDKPVATIVAQGEGAGVVAFRRAGHVATLVLDWEFYSARRQETAVYEFEFEEMKLETERQHSFID